MAAASYLGGPVTGMYTRLSRSAGADRSSTAVPDSRDAKRLCPISRYTPFLPVQGLQGPVADQPVAYQSALLTTPLLGLLLLFNLLIPLPAFLRTIFIIASVGVTFYTAFRAWKDAQEGLGRYWLPFIGEIAERWVNEE